jgi:hypothetical protein
MAVFDEHLNRQHRLSYLVRGPEWAFAIPQGDIAALEDVMRRCSGFWNGVGSLIVPVRSDGRMPRWLDASLMAAGVDECFTHEALRETAQAAVRRRFPDVFPLSDRFDRQETHPLHLRGPRPAPAASKPMMSVPEFHSAGLRRIALAVWGHIPDGEAEDWAAYYDVATLDGDAAHSALVSGQVGSESDSPLRLSGTGMGLVMQRSPFSRWAYIWVLSRSSFDELVVFWNFRARLLRTRRHASVVGIPRESLRFPERLRALLDWTPRVPGTRLTPDVFVWCGEKLQEHTRAALAELPFVEETATEFNDTTGPDVMPSDPRTFAFTRLMLGGRFVRGASESVLVSVNGGHSSLMLPAPHDFEARGLRRARLVLRNLPLPLPATNSAAESINVNAVAADGVMLSVYGGSDWNFDVVLPTSTEALGYWATDHGFSIEYTQDARDAEAILRRLGALNALDVLADRKRLRLLQVLAPKSRPKLVRRLIAEAADAGMHLDEEKMAERLADLGLFLEAEARTASDIASAMGAGTRKPDVFEQLSPLVEAGFVRRAQSVRCPQCRFHMLLDLGDQDEQVECRACRQAFVLPVVDESGRREPELMYRLDGLMARAMDQDVLPVLLALRALRPERGLTELFFAWPGVKFTREGTTVDIDLLVSNGETAWCVEAKNNATGLGEAQLHKVMDVAKRLGALPGIAAVEGSFDPALAEKVESAGGRVLTGENLLR